MPDEKITPQLPINPPGPLKPTPFAPDVAKPAVPPIYPTARVPDPSDRTVFGNLPGNRDSAQQYRDNQGQFGTQPEGRPYNPKESAYKEALVNPKVVDTEAGKTTSRTFTEEEVANLRSSLEPLIVHADIHRFHPAVQLVDSLLKDMGLRFESGHTIPEAHYLDLVHSIVVPDGQYYDVTSRTVLPVPAGLRYDRKTATLSRVPIVSSEPTCPHRTDGGYCALCRVTSPTLIEGEVHPRSSSSSIVSPETQPSARDYSNRDTDRLKTGEVGPKGSVGGWNTSGALETETERLNREKENHEPTHAPA